MIKDIGIRAYPAEGQKVLFRKTIGCKRLVWNKLLDGRTNHIDKNDCKLLNSTPAHLREDHSSLNQVDSMALCNVQL